MPENTPDTVTYDVQYRPHAAFLAGRMDRVRMRLELPAGAELGEISRAVARAAGEPAAVLSIDLVGIVLEGQRR